MQTFKQYWESRVLGADDIKRIIFNSLGINIDSAQEKDYLNNNLSDYSNRNEILRAQAIRELPNFDEIKRVITVDYNKFTIGTLISYIDKLVNPGEI
jgi:hypothetical protein